VSEQVFDQQAGKDTVTETETSYTVKAVETMHTTYAVKGKDSAQSAERLRRWFQDPAMVADGIVKVEAEPERVRWLIRGEKTKAKAS